MFIIGNATVRWTHNGKEVRQTKFVKLTQELIAGVTKSSVKFEQVFPEDEGEYVATILKAGTVVASSKGTLKVNAGN